MNDNAMFSLHNMTLDGTIGSTKPYSSIEYYSAYNKDIESNNWIKINPIVEHLRVFIFLTNVRLLDLNIEGSYKKVYSGGRTINFTDLRLTGGEKLLSVNRSESEILPNKIRTVWIWDSFFKGEFREAYVDMNNDGYSLIPFKFWDLYCKEQQIRKIKNQDYILSVLEKEI